MAEMCTDRERCVAATGFACCGERHAVTTFLDGCEASFALSRWFTERKRNDCASCTTQVNSQRDDSHHAYVGKQIIAARPGHQIVSLSDR